MLNIPNVSSQIQTLWYVNSSSNRTRLKAPDNVNNIYSSGITIILLFRAWKGELHELIQYEIPFRVTHWSSAWCVWLISSFACQLFIYALFRSMPFSSNEMLKAYLSYIWDIFYSSHCTFIHSQPHRRNKERVFPSWFSGLTSKINFEWAAASVFSH